MRTNDVPNTTSFLLDVLRAHGDRPEDAALQTRLFELVLLSGNVQVADAIFENEEYHFTQYNKQRVAALCERAGLFRRALGQFPFLVLLLYLELLVVVSNCDLPSTSFPFLFLSHFVFFFLSCAFLIDWVCWLAVWFASVFDFVVAVVVVVFSSQRTTLKLMIFIV